MSGRRSTLKISTTLKCNAGVTPQPMATAPMACSTPCREPASSGTTRASYSRRSARFTEVEAPEQAAAQKTSVAPDATFTLRLNFGTVQGWREGSQEVEPFTHTARLFERATGQEPFKVP